MEGSVKVTNVSLDYSEYYAEKNVSREIQEKFGCNDFLAVPKKYGENQYFFAQETVDFIKTCRKRKPEYSFDILADGDIEVRSLHSFDIWMPVIWMASYALIPIAMNLISSYIYDKMKGREKEDVNVDVQLYVKADDGKEKLISYHGNAKGFRECFEKIDISKM